MPDHAWREQLARIQSLRIELSSNDVPTSRAFSKPNPPASKRAISAAERKMRRRLPPSYRALLAEHDGWPTFFQGASLLGTQDLGRPRYADMVRSAFEAYETPIPEIAPRSRALHGANDTTRDFYPDAVIAFGCDPEGLLVVAFNPAVVRSDGEMEVIAWVHSIGYRFESFGEFLGMVADVLEADLADAAALRLRKSA